MLFEGGSAAETINGTENDDTIIGHAGNDTLNGLGGNDLFVWATAGLPVPSGGGFVVVSDGSDTDDGGAGNDTFEAHLEVYKKTDNGLLLFQTYAVSTSADGQHVYFTQRNGVTGFGSGGVTAQVDLKSIESLHIIGTPSAAPPPTVILGNFTAFSTNDTFVFSNLDATTLLGTITFDAGSGDDVLDASAVSNAVVANGQTGFDTLTTGAGDDVLSGGASDDQLNAGLGHDTALFFSARSEYDVRTFADGPVLKTIVAHQGGTQADGTDALTSVEVLGFANNTFNLAHAQLNHTSNVDGDRFDDVLFQNQTTGQVYFAKMIDGAFQSWGVDTAPLGTDWKAIGSGDVNPGPTGGAETFVQQQSTGTIYYASLDTGAITWGVVDAAPGPDWKLRAVGDMNGDATADAVLQNTTTGAIKYAAMFNGTSQGYDLVTNSLSGDWLLVGAGDVNRDGLAEAVVQQQSTGTIRYAVMSGGQFQTFVVVSQDLTPDWDVKAVADVTGDGFADLIVQQASTGTTYFADMKLGVLDHWGVVTGNVTAAWVVQGTADVDNDGFNDVLLQNQTNGTTYYANMGPAGFEGWGVVAGNISSDWHVV